MTACQASGIHIQPGRLITINKATTPSNRKSVFILIGGHEAHQRIDRVATAAVIAILLVLVSRALSVYLLSAAFIPTSLRIDARYQHDLSVGPKQPKDIEVDAGGMAVVMDLASARRADGVVVDLVKTPQGDAFRIDNPNEPPRVRPMSVQELEARLAAEPELPLFDVRTPEECAIAQIPGARLLDDAAQEHIFSLPKDTPLYFVCHHGGRSQAAAEHFVGQGYTKVFNVMGGVDSWAREIDPEMPRY